MTFARPTAMDAVRHIGLDASFARASLGAELPGFDRISEYVPREAQAKTMSLDRPTQGGIAILESETGSGKTEAALGRFVQLLHGGLVDGMVFALPTRTAATQIQRRVVEAIARAFPDPRDRPPVVLAVPGYLKVDDATGTKLADFRVLWNDNRAEQDHHRGWAAEQPKRYLAGAVVVGTIDQVLLSSLRVGHAHLRATALLRQLLVVDEVHASDAYMNRILEEVLRFHVASGGHAFLMSATLGTHVRQKLEHAALSSRATSGDDSALDAALSTPYPALHIAARGASPTTVAVAAPDRSKRIRIAVQGIADDPLQVAARALDAARVGARVLVLRNTVNDAVATHIAVEDLARESPLLFRVRNVVTLHHARFAKSDRELLDKTIEGRFGKSAPASGGAIVVCTQTVQQSLDLDSDILFTDLAPMDVLLQRFGRVHRHRERDADRPLGFDIAQGVILTGEGPLEESLRPNGEARGKHGIGTVYDNVLVLEATLRTLAAHAQLCIPDQNRELVELTTHPQALDGVAQSLGPIWQKHQNTVSGVKLAHVGLADLNLVERNRRFGEYSFKRTDLEERIASRLGESDRRAVFAEARPGPFGEVVRELTIPGWLAREAPPDPDLAPSDVRCDLRTSDGPSSHTVRFAFGPLGFVYDRLGLRREEATPGDDVADA
jgi:CRISPR-associated endonuclease/helicase Cas3